MAGINYGRVVIGGLAAGVVANVMDFISANVLLADDMARMAQRLNLNQALLASPTVALSWIAVDFVYGFLLVFAYAAIRPRFGPGPGTAVRAGLLLWAAVAVVLFGFTSMGVFTPDLFHKSSAFALISSVAAALTGAFLYKERA
jgi:hypothetical protein